MEEVNSYSSPGRKLATSIKEASVPLTAVEPLPPATSSRPGPACEKEDEVFQNFSTGKYVILPRTSSAVPFVDFSISPSIQILPTSSSWTPGRIFAACIKETPTLLTAVEPFPPTTSSRPGPACEHEDGVFRTPTTGKYADLSSISSAVSFVVSSITSSIHSRSTSLKSTPGRTFSASLKEAPIPFTAVEPFLPATSSRPGPACDLEDGVFRAPMKGKYTDLPSISSAVSFVDSRNLVPKDALTDSRLYDLWTTALGDPQLAIAGPSRNSACFSAIPKLQLTAKPSIPFNVSGGSTQHKRPERCPENPSDMLFDLRIYYQNVRGLRTKIDDVFLSTAELDYDVYVFTETWLDECIESRQLFSPDYSVFRVDRCATNSSRRRGGGVLIAVKEKFGTTVVSTRANIEQLWVKMSTQVTDIFIGALYIPPDKSQDGTFMQLHLDVISEVCSSRSDASPLVVFGDFNQPRLAWLLSNGYAIVDALNSHISSASQILLDNMAFQGLRQRNSIRNSSGRVLDLVFSDDSSKKSVLATPATEHVVPLDRYHPALDFSVQIPSSMTFYEDIDLSERDFRRCNFDALNSLLSQVDWSEVHQCSDVDSAVTCFNAIIHNYIAETVPLNRPPRKPAWSNRHLGVLRRRRDKLLQQYNRQKCAHFKRQLDEASRIYRGYNRFLYKNYVSRKQNDLRRNPKSFWNFVNSKRKEHGLPTTMHRGDVFTSSQDEKCALFAQQFSSVFVGRIPTVQDTEAATCIVPRDVVDLDIFHVNESMVYAALQKLKLSNCPGPDGIPSCIFRKCGASLVAPLVSIFNKSLQSQLFPTAWKTSYMRPVFKKGDKTDFANYRGITSLSAGAKCLETIVNKVMFSSFCCYISEAQHGFFPRRSVESNLVDFTSTCIRSMDNGAQIDAVYTDIKAAFDTVNHEILLAKLLRLGVSTRMCNWLQSYLRNRSLCVKVGSTVSHPFHPASGVPQGSNLGPLLFSLFFNDVTIVLANGGLLIYADDLKIFLVVRTEADCRDLQELLNQFARWCTMNFLAVSVSKCCVISYRRCKSPILYDYNINGQELERVDKVKDLGVLLDYRLTFKLHYATIIDKANRQLGFILKITKEFNDPMCLRSLYCSLVRSILEFASIVWSPYEAVWITRIEAVQRKFVRHALRDLPWRDPLNLPPYDHRCRLLGLEPLHVRRKNSRAVYGSKIVRTEVDCPALLQHVQFYAPERVLRTRQLIQIASRNTGYGANDPLNSICNEFRQAYGVFDFNLTTNTFRQRLSRTRFIN